MIFHRFYKTLTNTTIIVWESTGPIVDSYAFVDQINQWLTESEIVFSQQQWGQQFEWHIYDQDSANLFVMRWM